MNNIEPLKDTVKYVRENPSRFLPYEHNIAEPDSLAGIVASSVALLTEEEVVTKCLGKWWIIASTFDWIDNASSSQYFNELVPFPEAGDNSFHPEILLTAFSCCVVTNYQSNSQIISGNVDKADVIWDWFKSNSKYKRVIAFSMN